MTDQVAARDGASRGRYNGAKLEELMTRFGNAITTRALRAGVEALEANRLFRDA
jgi:hypothetical protein